MNIIRDAFERLEAANSYAISNEYLVEVYVAFKRIQLATDSERYAAFSLLAGCECSVIEKIVGTRMWGGSFPWDDKSEYAEKYMSCPEIDSNIFDEKQRYLTILENAEYDGRFKLLVLDVEERLGQIVIKERQDRFLRNANRDQMAYGPYGHYMTRFFLKESD